MSPEQARGRRDLDHRADLWALGVIAFECITGRRPFESEVLGDLLIKICTDPIPMPSSFAPVPFGFDAWFARALERDPSRRFTSAIDMAQALRALAPASTPMPSEPRAVSFPPPVQAAMAAPLSASATPARSTNLVWIIAAIVVPLIGLVLAGVFLVIYLIKPEFGLAGSAEPQLPSAAPSAVLPSETTTPSASPSAAPSSTPRPMTTAKTPASSTSAPPTSTGASSDSCQKACAKIAACGQKCNFGGPCVGIAKSVADCINSKKTCLDMAGCGG